MGCGKTNVSNAGKPTLLKQETKDALKEAKLHPKETYDEVIWRLLSK